METLSAVIGILGMFATVGWIFHTVLTNATKRKIASSRAEVHLRLFDRVGSTADAMQYLQSAEGKRLFELEPPGVPPVQGRILGAVQVGVVLAFAGLGLMYLGGRFPSHVEALLTAAVLCLAVGVGFLVSSLSSYVLARRWGLLTEGTGSGHAVMDDPVD